MKYSDLSKENKKIYQNLLEDAVGPAIVRSEEGQPLYFDAKGQMVEYHEQVITEMQKRECFPLRIAHKKLGGTELS